MSETHDYRLNRLVDDIQELKVVLSRLETMIIGIDHRLTRELPQLTNKPGKVWLATALSVLLVAYAAGGLVGIAAVAKLFY